MAGPPFSFNRLPVSEQIGCLRKDKGDHLEEFVGEWARRVTKVMTDVLGGETEKGRVLGHGLSKNWVQH